MRCPSCRTVHDVSAECVSEDLPPSDDLDLDSANDVTREFELSNQSNKKTSAQSRLIEFPGSRNAMPVWRKELAERVREAQERKARETAAAEDGLENSAAPQLELLPQAEAAPVNPLVAAALKRIERAHLATAPTVSNVSKPLAAVAYAHSNYEPVVEPSTASQVAVLEEAVVESYARPQTFEEPETRPFELEPRTPNLVVVQTTETAPAEAEEIRRDALPISRSRRVISDDASNPALNYLDSIPTALRVDRTTQSAGALRRLFAGLLDLALLTLLYSPIALGLELVQGNWLNPQVMALAITSLFLIGFLYFTVCTGLTGRTFGLRILGLRIVDVRTGLIPTGGQSAKRSFLYLFSLLSAGLLFLGILLDSDHRTPHERFSRTAIVRA